METMLYIGLFSIIILIVINYMLSMQEITLRTKRSNDIHQASEFIIRHLDYSFDHALSISDSNSIFEDDNGRLELLFDSGNKQYYLDNSQLYFNGVSITPSTVLIESFFITPVYKGSSLGIGTRIDMVLESSSDPSSTKSVDILFVL